MKKADMVLLIALLSPIPPGIIMWVKGFGWEYLGTNILFDCCFGIMEMISIKTRKRSISRDIANTPKWLFWTVIATWEIMQVGIAVHWIMMR